MAVSSENSRGLASSITNLNTSSSTSSSSRLHIHETSIANNGTVQNSKFNGHEAIAQAFLVAKQLASKSGVPTKPVVYSQELDINDYPPQARKKCMQKQFTDELLDRTGVAIISRGSHIPPNVKLQPGEKRLHLLIEGDTEKNVKQAIKDITQLLEDETRKLSTLGAPGGRYSVI